MENDRTENPSTVTVALRVLTNGCVHMSTVLLRAISLTFFFLGGHTPESLNPCEPRLL